MAKIIIMRILIVMIVLGLGIAGGAIYTNNVKMNNNTGLSGHGDHADRSSEVMADTEKLGDVNFPVTCNEPAQTEFNRAMALYHSFWFGPAIKSFTKVKELDANCGMADWGIAFMRLGNPFAWPPNPDAMKAGEDALKGAHRTGVKSERERAYISALDEIFKNWETTDYRQRAAAYEKRMEALAAEYPQDIEAQILYALALNITALPTDKTYSHQIKAGSILEPLFKKYPFHPGISHYLIHTYDYTELSPKGLPAARSFAAISPSVPHAMHMPSHIFARLGLWEEMVKANEASYNAAKAELKESTMAVGTYDALHAMDYLVFGYLQQARDKAAKELVEEAGKIHTVNVENFVAAYAFAAIPSRYAAERGDWKKAALLNLSPPKLAWNKFPQAEAVLIFTRALGKARTGDTMSAKEDVKRLQELKDTMIASKADYWAGQTSIQIDTVNAWIALEENKNKDAVHLMNLAAEAEEASDKHPVTPGNIIPARELLGEMHMSLNQPGQALVEFERSLKRDPNRFRSMYGAALAAESSDYSTTARNYYTKLMELTADNDTTRPEVITAKEFLATKE